MFHGNQVQEVQATRVVRLTVPVLFVGNIRRS